MGHAVHYRTSSGESKLEEVSSLDAAIALVERLRNDDGASDVKVFREVPIEFKTYYKVVVGGEEQDAPAQDEAATASTSAGSPPPGAMPISPPPVSAVPSAQPTVQVNEQLDEGDTGRRASLFSRG